MTVGSLNQKQTQGSIESRIHFMSIELNQRVGRIVQSTPVHDIHTHLYDPSFGSLLLWGIDEQLIYHYLISESFRQFDSTISYEKFWAFSKEQQANLIWDALFVRHSPLSEACRGVITTLNALGIDPKQTDLDLIRKWFAQQKPEAHVERVLDIANIASICMTNSPFDPEETPYWNVNTSRDPRFLAALRIDPLLLAWPNTCQILGQKGYKVAHDRSTKTVDEVRRFLADWTQRLDSRYCMVSLPPTFGWPEDSDTSWLIQHAVLPHCRDFGQPFALMMGVKRCVNPRLRLAGDGVGQSDLDALQNLCAANPDNRFLVTCLSRENQYQLAVLARKFRNLHPFGCWWFTNTSQLIEEITTLRLDLLGPSFTPQHSDSRVLDQLIYKWQNSRQIIAKVLTKKYSNLEESGWEITDGEIQRDVGQLLGLAFHQFCR